MAFGISLGMLCYALLQYSIPQLVISTHLQLSDLLLARESCNLGITQDLKHPQAYASMYRNIRCYLCDNMHLCNLEAILPEEEQKKKKSEAILYESSQKDIMTRNIVMVGYLSRLL